MVKMRYIVTILTCCLSSFSYGQGIVSGRVFDKNSDALDAVLVYLYQSKDSCLVKQIMTDADGKFKFENVTKGSYYLRASLLGVDSQTKKIILWDKSHVTVDLTIDNTIQLEEVKVVSTGVTINGDTTSYAVRQFTSGTERNLKDVIERLPNVNVDRETKSVTANGKHVNRILLEGQDLFQGNTSIPLDNLSADGIRRIDVIDNYSEYNIYDGFKTTNETVMNVGLDAKAKNSISGELEGNGGILNKYGGRNTLLYIGKKTMLSNIIASNNIGTRLLTFRDIIQFSGGLSNMLSGDNPMEEIQEKMNTYSAFTDNRRDIACRENTMASLNVIANPYRNIKLSIVGIYGYDNNRSHKENSYRYLSGLNYTEETKENNSQHNGLLNIKLAYTPNKDFNVIYSGNMLLVSHNMDVTNDLMNQDRIAYHTIPKNLSLKNNILVAKRIGKDVVNLSIDQSFRNYKENSTFESSKNYYQSSLNIADVYEYDYSRKTNAYSAQLFYLHRISTIYYLRLSLKVEDDKQWFTTSHRQSFVFGEYDNDEYVDYNIYNTDATIGKDNGKMTYALRLRYAFWHASTNIKRTFERSNDHSLYPMFRVKYQFTPYHTLTFSYEYMPKKRDISDLIDGKWLKTYKQVESSSVDNLFASSHRLSLSHLLTLQYVGLNIINNVSYELTNNPVIKNYSQYGYVSCVEKLQGDHDGVFTLMSQAEYKFLNVPLNVRYGVNYNHNKSLMYYNNTHHNTSLDGIIQRIQLVTFYKKGVNVDLEWQLSRQTYRGVSIDNCLATNTLMGNVSWHDSKVYVGFDAKLIKYNLADTRTTNMYYGVELRYQLNGRVLLKLNGVDVMHLKNRQQMTGSTTEYNTVNSLTDYMPGYIMAGISVKY